jgi:membrane-bound serine protease (ClpP class)
MRTHRNWRRAARLALGLALIVPFLARAEEEPETPAPGARRVVIDEALKPTEAARVTRRVDALVAEGVSTILFELDGAGGDPADVLDLASRVHDLDARTIAVLPSRANGGHALLALACDEIVMTPAAQLGPIDCGDDATKRSSVQAAARRFAGKRSELLVAAMIDPGIAVRRMVYDDGTPPRLVEAPDLPRARVEAAGRGAKIREEVLVREDELLTLTAEQARDAGFASRVVASAEALAAELGIEASAAERPAEVAAPGEWTPRPSKKAAVILLDDPIFAGLEARILRRLDQIEEDGTYDLLLIETDSPGGLVTASIKIGDRILEIGEKIHTVVWVRRQAISGAALTSFAAREILMSPSGTIGDCQPIMQTMQGIEVGGEKIQSPLRATFRKYAERNGYPIPVLESMVTQEHEVLRVEDERGKAHYFERKDYDALSSDERAAYAEPDVIVEADKLPTFTAREAVKYDIARRIVASREAVLELYGVEPENVTVFEVTWSEKASEFLLQWKGILFLIGLVALYLEFKAPGFGVAGIVGIAAFALFFLAGSIGGLAEATEIILFGIGVALIIVEIFLTPGFGIPGIAGILLIIVSLYLASSPFVVPNTPDAQSYFVDWIKHFGGALVAATVLAVVLARFLPSIPYFRRLVLAPPAAEGLAASAATVGRENSDLVGRQGTALTDLRPAGRIELEGRRIDVVTQGSFVEEGALVEVLRVNGNRVVVRPVGTEAEPDDRPETRYDIG